MEEIIENNRIIAEFIGLKVEDEDERIFINGLGTRLLEDTFNKSWDWLMQVVEKIESLEDNRYNIEINNLWCNIYDTKIMDVFEYMEDSKINSVYGACLEFIKGYNSQNINKH